MVVAVDDIAVGLIVLEVVLVRMVAGSDTVVGAVVVVDVIVVAAVIVFAIAAQEEVQAGCTEQWV
jgi:hypothetical protein